MAGTPPDAAAADPVQPQIDAELPEAFQDRVNALVQEKGKSFGGHIRSKADVDRYERAIWAAKWKGGELENKCADFPEDEDQQSAIVRRIFEAIVNTEGDQDLTSDASENGNCLAVRTIQKLSSLEIEILAWKAMVSTDETPVIEYC